jgi:hypothetical protein
MRFIGATALFLSMLATACAAQEISGTNIIKRRLTRRSVTPSVSVYQRGTSVKVGRTADEDPIGFEQSRVVVYLEGNVAANPDTVRPSRPVEIRQSNRQFLPDLVVVPDCRRSRRCQSNSASPPYHS